MNHLTSINTSEVHGQDYERLYQIAAATGTKAAGYEGDAMVYSSETSWGAARFRAVLRDELAIYADAI